MSSKTFIVTNTLREPLPGWADNLNGPIGLCVALIKGVLRTLYVDGDVPLDIVPADAVVNSLLMITCKTVGKRNFKNIDVYNNSRQGMTPRYYKQNKIYAENHLSMYPLCNSIWYPGATLSKCKYLYFIRVLLVHMLPAILLDSLAKLSGLEPRLVKIQKKAYIANVVLEHFMFNGWKFHNSKLLELEKELSPEEYEKFGFSPFFEQSEMEFLEYLKDCLIRVDTDLLNLKHDFSNNNRILYRLWILDVTVKSVLAGLFIWMVIEYNVIGILYGRVENYLSNL